MTQGDTKKKKKPTPGDTRRHSATLGDTQKKKKAKNDKATLLGDIRSRSPVIL
jgi:hypothetical protein